MTLIHLVAASLPNGTSQKNPDQRLKLTMFVIGRELRSDAITVRAYIQNRLGTEWVDAGRDEELGRKLEDLVLTRARELRATANSLKRLINLRPYIDYPNPPFTVILTILHGNIDHKSSIQSGLHHMWRNGRRAGK